MHGNLLEGMAGMVGYAFRPTTFSSVREGTTTARSVQFSVLRLRKSRDVVDRGVVCKAPRLHGARWRDVHTRAKRKMQGGRHGAD